MRPPLLALAALLLAGCPFRPTAERTSATAGSGVGATASGGAGSTGGTAATASGSSAGTTGGSSSGTTGACRDLGATCLNGSAECCGPSICVALGSPADGACCRPEGAPCAATADCCPNDGAPGDALACRGGTCQRPPPADAGCQAGARGQACTRQSGCCDGLTCTDATYGRCCVSGGPCASDADCCGPDQPGQQLSRCEQGQCVLHGCNPLGTACGVCCPGSGCDPATSQCRLYPGLPCRSAAECQTGADCAGGTCTEVDGGPACHGVSQPCASDADCCAGTACSAGTCELPPFCVASLGGGCGGADGPTCCAGMECQGIRDIFIVDGHCCAPLGTACASDVDCCGSAPYGTGRGVCGPGGACTAEPDAGPFCADLGTFCGLDNPPCCSGLSCIDLGIGGACCKEGTPCSTDDDCCGAGQPGLPRTVCVAGTCDLPGSTTGTSGTTGCGSTGSTGC